jgi:hypothetical protein
MIERAIPERVFVTSALNVSALERGLSFAASLWLTARLIRDRKISNRTTKAAFALGIAALVRRSLTGHSQLYGALGIGSKKPVSKVPETTSVGAVSAIQRSITIRASLDEIQLFFEDAPKLARVSVELRPHRISDREREFRLKLESGEVIDGLFILIDGPFEKGTEIQARIQKIPFGLKSEVADQRLRQVLRSAKQMIETGEVATVEGQTHGHREVETIAYKLKGRLRHASTLLERS